MDKNILKGFVIGVVLFLGLIFVLGKLSDRFGTTPIGSFIEVKEGNQIIGNIKNSKEINLESEKTVLKGYNNLLLKILDLRESYIDSDIIQTAGLVTEIDDIITSLDNDPVTDNWETITLCLARKTCNDEGFLDFILTIALEGDKIGLSKGDLIVDLLTANKYWNSDNIVKFSYALTATNEAINDINDETLSSKWLDIVECDGGCSDRDELIFDIIRLIVG